MCNSLDLRKIITPYAKFTKKIRFFAQNTQNSTFYASSRGGFTIFFKDGLSSAPDINQFIGTMQKQDDTATMRVSLNFTQKHNTICARSDNILLNYYKKARPIMFKLKITVTVIPIFKNLIDDIGDQPARISMGMRYSEDPYDNTPDMAGDVNGNQVDPNNNLVLAKGRSDMVWKHRTILWQKNEAGGNYKPIHFRFSAMVKPWKLLNITKTNYMSTDDYNVNVNQGSNPFNASIDTSNIDIGNIQFFMDTSDFLAEAITNNHAVPDNAYGIPINTDNLSIKISGSLAKDYLLTVPDFAAADLQTLNQS